MARTLRREFDGALYHVMSRGNERRPSSRITKIANCYGTPSPESIPVITGGPGDTERATVCKAAGAEKFIEDFSESKDAERFCVASRCNTARP